MRDYYEPKMIMGVIKETKPLRTFFKTRFFSNPVMFPTEKVYFEFQESKRRLAPYVNPRIGAEDIGRDEYGVKDYTAPLISPKRTITNDTLMQKLIGEPSYNSAWRGPGGTGHPRPARYYLAARGIHVCPSEAGRQAHHQGKRCE